MTHKCIKPLTPEQQTLVENDDGLVRDIARSIENRLPPGVVDLDDLIQIGRIGLCEAASRWKPGPVRFLVFASTRVRGAMLDSLRQTQFRGLGRESWDRVSISALTSDHPTSYTPHYTNEITIREITDLILHLPDERHRIVLLDMLEGEQQKEIAEKLGYAASRVPQLQNEAYNQLREMLNV